MNSVAIGGEPGGALTGYRPGSGQYAARFTEEGYSTVQATEQRVDEYRLHAEQLRARADQLSLYPATRDLLLSLVAQYQELAANIEQPRRGWPGPARRPAAGGGSLIGAGGGCSRFGMGIGAGGSVIGGGSDGSGGGTGGMPGGGGGCGP